MTTGHGSLLNVIRNLKAKIEFSKLSKLRDYLWFINAYLPSSFSNFNKKLELVKEQADNEAADRQKFRGKQN